jgi:hypothetical protein
MPVDKKYIVTIGKEYDCIESNKVRLVTVREKGKKGKTSYVFMEVCSDALADQVAELVRAKIKDEKGL